MPIGISGQFEISFSVGGITDFIAADDLLNFKIIERAGNSLPEFDLSFISNNEKILKYLHEGNDIIVTFNKDRETKIETKLAGITLEIKPYDRSSRIYAVSGYYSALDYHISERTRILGPSSGISTMRNVVGDHFSPDFNVLTSLDTQRWIQHGISDRKFVSKHLWLHSNLGNSFPVIGISMDGRFICKDVFRASLLPARWRFVPDSRGPRDITYNQDWSIRGVTGFNNLFSGYGRRKIQYDLESGSGSEVLERPTPFLSNTSELMRRPDVTNNFGGSIPRTDNVHSNYWQSRDHNFAQLIAFGNITLTLTFTDRFVPIRVLDFAFFRELTGEDRTSDFLSGKYMVNKVARIISGRQLTTTIELSRESINEIRNLGT